jgi:molecular chaperone HscB
MDQLQQNYFALFHLPQAFEVDLSLLDQQYRKIQSEIHPDRYTNASSNELMRSMQLATYANEAYRSLKDSTARARYLLQLEGVETLEESNTAMPTDFLMLQMEWREAIDDALQNKNISALDDLLITIKEISKSLSQQLSQAFKQKDYVTAAESVRKLSFIDKITGDIHRNIETLEA